MKTIVSASASAVPQFFDLDPMNIVWHGNYPRFLELGRVAVMERIGYSYEEMVESGFAWPIIDLRMRYIRPMRLNQPVKITAGIVEWESILRITYLVQNEATGERVMRASSSQVALRINTQEMLWVTPPVLRARLEPFLSPAG
ncbi:thioesterase family protein [Brevundimonas sp. M20]|uniref:acyl-CoA thioesterase n=1 Tax=Brevundimonas sp. M20 TaxID=2591463 RepID=UPI00197B06B3|nr:acyl-CoA thioesterase [Brevundimonas sp. M20]